MVAERGLVLQGARLLEGLSETVQGPPPPPPESASSDAGAGGGAGVRRPGLTPQAVPATVNGMLGGYESLSDADAAGSLEFLKEFVTG